MPKRTRPWKQAYRRLPPHITAQLAGLAGDARVTVGCSRRLDSADVDAGLWDHTGITNAGNTLDVPAGFLPSRDMGRHSRWNIDGRKVPMKDRPKVIVTFCHDSPNFGDYSKGSHMVCHDREVWQKRTTYGKSLEITMEALGPAGDGQDVVFRIDEPLDRRSGDFDRELLEAVNILQENVGCADVRAAGAEAEAYAGTVRVTWELLPVGSRDEVVEAVKQRLGRGGPVPDTVSERLAVFHGLNPRNIVIGTSGFSRYIGAQIRDDLVVLENPIHGNAVYVLGSDWAEVSQRSRIDLLRDENAHYDRVVHTPGWDKRLRDIIDSRLR